jgi:hypothetical protein
MVFYSPTHLNLIGLWRHSRCRLIYSLSVLSYTSVIPSILSSRIWYIHPIWSDDVFSAPCVFLLLLSTRIYFFHFSDVNLLASCCHMTIQINMKSKPHPVGASSEILFSSTYCFFFVTGLRSLCLPLLRSPKSNPPPYTSWKIELDSKKIRRKTSENKENEKQKSLFFVLLNYLKDPALSAPPVRPHRLSPCNMYPLCMYRRRSPFVRTVQQCNEVLYSWMPTGSALIFLPPSVLSISFSLSLSLSRLDFIAEPVDFVHT